ncbi:MAG: DUF4390 domain-containing protein [Gemmatimonadota bacterium]
MTRFAVLGLAAALLLTAAPAPLQGQVSLDVRAGAPYLIVGGVLDDEALEDAVRSGLPLWMRFRLELWRDETFDDLVAQSAWTAVVAFEPLQREFVAGVAVEDSLRSYPSWDAARNAVERTYAAPLVPPSTGTYYYIGLLEIETLSLSDLDELERWLRGELEPAVRGRRSLGGAIGTGLKRLLIRLLGLPARSFEVRSEPFPVP